MLVVTAYIRLIGSSPALISRDSNEERRGECKEKRIDGRRKEKRKINNGDEDAGEERRKRREQEELV